MADHNDGYVEEYVIESHSAAAVAGTIDEDDEDDEYYEPNHP